MQKSRERDFALVSAPELAAPVAASAPATVLATDVETPDTGETAIRDAELLLAALRTLLLLALAIAPRVLHISEAYQPGSIILMAIAGVYNIFTIVASIYPARFCLRRPLIIAMDATLISAWIHLSGRWDLIPFYYVVVVMAAMWYRVLGGVVAAAVCDFLFLMLWARLAADPALLRPPDFPTVMTLNGILLFVIGALAGYVAEAQDREREHRLERELLIANYQQEIDLSGELQPLLLGRLEKSAPDFDIGAALQSARSVGGGDYLDAIPLPDGTTLLCIADVSGKSIRAQARVPLLKYSLRALAPLHPDPAELMARLQTTLLPDLGPELYIALCLVVLDARQECLTWCNAGHLAPLLVRGQQGGAAPLELAATAPALGLFPDLKIAQKSLGWRRGDALLMFTDGLPDALSFGGEIDGEAQITTLAQQLDGALGAAEIARELVGLASVALNDKPFVARHFTLGEQAVAPHVHRDDVAVLVARYAPLPAPTTKEL